MEIIDHNPLVKKNTVLIIAKHLDGGTGTYASQLLNLNNKTSTFRVFLVGLYSPSYRKISSKYQGVPYLYPNTKRINRHTTSLPSACRFLRELLWLSRHVERLHPKVIIGVDVHCNLLVVILKIVFRRNVKVLLTFHNNVSSLAFYKATRVARWMMKTGCGYLFRFADAHIGVSKGVSDDVHRYFSLPQKPCTIYNGVDYKYLLQRANSSIDTTEFNNAKRRVVFVGRLERQKGIETLIYAFRRVIQIVPDTVLFLVGNGDGRAELQELVATANMKSYIVFLGWKKNPFRYIKNADIFVLPSVYEGFPYVLLESLAVRTPIVTTDAPYGPREILGNNTYGLLVPPRNTDALATAIIRLLTNSKLCEEFRALATGRVKQFSEDKMFSEYQKVLGQCLG